METYETNAASAAALTEDSYVQSSNSGTEVDYTGDATGTVEDFIRTEAAPAEVPKTLKHRGSLTSVTAITSKEKGSRGIEVSVHSDSNGKDYKTTIWPPAQWTANVFITGEELAKLPGPEGLTAAGNPKQTPYQRFGRTIRSTDGSAELQRLITAGTKAGRTLNSNYTDFDTLVENLNAGLAGMPIVFTTGADGDPDPQYGFRIKVRNVYPFDAKYDKIRAESADGQ